MTLQHQTIRTCLAGVALAASLACLPVRAQSQGEFLFFPQLNGTWTDYPNDAEPRDGSHHAGLDDRYTEIGVDLFATWEKGRFRFLAEFLLTDEEQDLERIQLGWRFGDHTLWAGRFHNAIGYWNTMYHHGAYLQASISRPAIVDYEEHGGVIPMHQAGIEWEGVIGEPALGLGYSLSVAAGPWFNGEELHIWDALDSSEGDHDLSTTLNVDREWEWGRAGAFFNFNRIPTALLDLPEIEQSITGVFFDKSWRRARLHGSAMLVSNRLEYTAGGQRDRFSNAFVQFEFPAGGQLTFFGRAEASFGDSDNAYLDLFPAFVRQRLMGGIRWDPFDCSALKLEVSSNETETIRYEQLMLQWSAQL